MAPVFSTLTCHYLQVAGSFFNRYEVRRLVVLPLLVSLSFHVLFHSPSGVLFTFPSRYCFAIGHSGIFSLTRWSSQIHTGFHVSHATRDTTLVFKVFDYRIFTFCDVSFQRLRLTYSIYGWLSHNPTLDKFRLFPFRSPLLWESLLLSFPLVTEMFQFTRFALTYLCIKYAV